VASVPHSDLKTLVFYCTFPMTRVIPLLLLILATRSPAQILTYTQYPLPAGANPGGMTAGPDGALWFGDFEVNPRAIAVDAAGDLFIADRGSSRVLELTPGGALIRVAGTGTVGFTGDSGPAAAAQIGFPAGVVSDSSGRVYFSDQGNGRVRVLTPVAPPAIATSPAPPAALR